MSGLTVSDDDFILNIPEPVFLGFLGVLALLLVGTIAALILPRAQPGKWTDLGPRDRKSVV